MIDQITINGTIVASKSKTVPPTTTPFFSGSIVMVSVGSVSFLISHHKACPSVETEKNSDPEKRKRS